MNVSVSNPHGYCTGVIRAIELVKKAREQHPSGDIFVLGSIVHNEDVIDSLSDIGIVTVRDSNKTQADLLHSLPDASIVVFTAHGHDRHLDALAKEKGMIIYDATCPMVEDNHRIIQNEIRLNHQVIYIGKRLHPEAIAALSFSPQVFLLERVADFPFGSIIDPSPLVINQTTLSLAKLHAIHDEILARIPMARIADEICDATRLRQKGVTNLPMETELIYVVGGENSSNTQSLFDIAREHFPSAKVMKILNELDIDKNDLIGLDHISVVSGASTPLETTNRVVEMLKSI